MKRQLGRRVGGDMASPYMEGGECPRRTRRTATHSSRRTSLGPHRYTSDEAGTEDDARLAITGLMRELLRTATDAMARVQPDWLPLAFIARHEPRSQVIGG